KLSRLWKPRRAKRQAAADGLFGPAEQSKVAETGEVSVDTPDRSGNRGFDLVDRRTGPNAHLGCYSTAGVGRVGASARRFEPCSTRREHLRERLADAHRGAQYRCAAR